MGRQHRQAPDLREGAQEPITVRTGMLQPLYDDRNTFFFFFLRKQDMMEMSSAGIRDCRDLYKLIATVNCDIMPTTGISTYVSL